MEDIYSLNRGKLGFGLMRLPKDSSGAIDEKETARMVDLFLEKGFTYFDTAYAYPGSEEILRKTVVERHPRKSYTVASKMSGWMLTDELPPERMFAEQLRRTGLEYFDFYLIHSIETQHIPVYEKHRVWDFCSRMKAEGRIRHLGFSFHDTPEMLDGILTEHPEAEFVQLQINYMDWMSPRVQSRNVYETARKHGKPIIIMEPVKGGLLSNLEPSLTKPFGSRTPASMALRFAAGLDGVLAVLSGMSTMEQLKQNIATFSPLEKLSEAEMEAVTTVRESIEKLQMIQCTGCRYCIPECPKSIPIPNIFRAMNESTVRSDSEASRRRYEEVFSDGKSRRPSDCMKCGRCEHTCPQKLPIRKLLEEAAARFE